LGLAAPTNKERHNLARLKACKRCGGGCVATHPFQRYRPAYFVSGHSHEFPYFPDRDLGIVNGVNVLVPGQLLSAPFPNHIVLNTESKEATWETSSREWIPEDGLYDHLVVKFPRE
jgi:hypothetical protein